MRTIRLIAASGWLVACLLGCSGDDSGAASPTFASRLSAAQALGDPDARDKEIAKVAVEAADAGQGVVANDAVAAISDVGLRDQTAAKATLRLAKAGQRSWAEEVIKSIRNPRLVERITTKVQKKDFGN